MICVTRAEMVDGRLRIEILGWDKLWSFKSAFDIPLENVVEVRPVRDETWLGGGLRMPGTCLPGVIKAGTYYRGGEKVFWDVHRLENALVIELRNEPYARLILEVENPSALPKA
jgi:hypothetical protein